MKAFLVFYIIEDIKLVIKQQKPLKLKSIYNITDLYISKIP